MALYQIIQTDIDFFQVKRDSNELRNFTTYNDALSYLLALKDLGDLPKILHQEDF